MPGGVISEKPNDPLDKPIRCRANFNTRFRRPSLQMGGGKLGDLTDAIFANLFHKSLDGGFDRQRA